MLKRRTWPAYTASVAVAMLAGAALIGPQGASAASAGRPGAPAGHVMVPVGPAPGIPPGAGITGPEAGSASLRITVALRSADPSGLRRLASRVSSHGSAGFRHFLRPCQVQARFGPRRGAAAAVRAWLNRHHLSTRPALGDGLLMPATGSVAGIEAAFRTRIDRVRLPGGRTALLNRRAHGCPLICAAGCPPSSASAPCTCRGPASRPEPFPGPGPAAPPGPPGTSTRPPGWLTPTSSTRSTAHHDFGQHVTVALFELADYANRDIRAYTRCYRVHPSIRRVRVDGGTSVAASGTGTLEVTADVEVVAAMAPRASVLVYEAPLAGGDQSIVDTYGAIAQQDRAQVISSSWGGCEPLAGAPVIRIEAQLFQEMALQGQSMMAAAGDSGSEGCLPDVKAIPARLAYSLQVGNPASQPFVTAVGGTTITRYGSPPAQSAWNQTPAGMGFPAPFSGRHGRPGKYPGNLAGSGGISRVWRMPSWQAAFVRGRHASGARCGAPRGTGCREVPDVSALAAIGTRGTRGYVIYGTAGAFKGQGWLTVGGTSLATPLWAALTALADRQAPGHRLGLLSPSLYPVARSDPRAFTDVAAGNNDYLAASGRHSHHRCPFRGQRDQPCYRAARGYDMATGLGTPQAGYLVTGLLRERAGRA